MKFPRVTVILPTYNRAELLKAAIEGILRQTYSNFELIVVDDGSTDRTEEVARSFADDRIRYIKTPHRGGAFARNEAIRSAHGEYIASQDDDDEWEPTFLEEQVNHFDSLGKDYGMNYVAYYRILPSGKKVKMPPKHADPKSGTIYPGPILLKNYCPFQAAMIRKSVFDDVGLVCEEIDSLYDWEMWLRISKKYKIGHVAKFLFTWRFTPNSNSSDPKKFWRQVEAREYILKHYGEDIKRYGYFTGHMSRIADLAIQSIGAGRARKYLLAGIKNDPTSFVLWAKLFATLFGKRGYLALRTFWMSPLPF